MIRSCIAFTLACGAVAGCSEAASPDAAAQLCERQEQLRAGLGPTIDDHFEVMAHLLPGGFGGLTIDSVFLKDTTKADTARAIAHVLGPPLPAGQGAR